MWTASRLIFNSVAASSAATADDLSVSMSSLSSNRGPNDEQAAAHVTKQLKNFRFHFRGSANLWSLFFQEICAAAAATPSGGYTRLPARVMRCLAAYARKKLNELLLADGGAGDDLVIDGSQRPTMAPRFAGTEPESNSENDGKCVVIGDNNALVSLCRLVRAAVTLEAHVKGSVAGVRHLLDCPLRMHEERYERPDEFLSLDKRNAQAVLDGLFVAVNWNRELVSSFAKGGDASVTEACVRRMRLVCTLQRRIAKLLRSGPVAYTPAPLDDSNHYPTGQRCSSVRGRVAPGESSGDDDEEEKDGGDFSSTANSVKKGAKSTTGGGGGGRKKKAVASPAFTFRAYAEQVCLTELSVEVMSLLDNALEFDGDGSESAASDLFYRGCL